MQTQLNISGMSCGHCVAAVKSALNALPGVSAVDVTLEPGRATIDHDGTTPVSEMIAAVVEEGYEASDNVSA